MVTTMKNSTFDYYFFYYNRKKIRDSFFLDVFPLFVKKIILKHYTVDQYNLMDKIVIISKILLFSLIYFIIYKATYVNEEAALVIPYTVLGLVALFSLFSLLSYSKQTIPDIEHNHYYRMLGDNRNDLVKNVMYKRNIYAFTNWIVPLTLFPFVYAAIVIGYEYIVFYFIIIVLFFYILNIVVFLSQRILFDYLKKMVIIDTVVLFLIMGFISLSTLFLVVGPTSLISLISIVPIEVLINVLVYSVMIVGFHKLNLKVMKSTINYSITSTIVLTKKSRTKRNQMIEPNRFIKFFYTNDNFRNKMINKDFITYYRKDKKEFFVVIILMVSAIVYSLFIGASSNAKEADLLRTIILDVNFNFIICLIFINNLFKQKDITWYSSEGRNILFYSRLGYDKYQVLKAKLKINYILNGIYLFFYMIVPVFFIFTTNLEGAIYMGLRVIVIYLLYSNIIDYFLTEDATNPRAYKYDQLAGMGKFNMMTLIAMGSGVIAFVYFKSTDETSLISTVPNLGFIVMGVVIGILTIIKIINIMKQQKFKGIFEGGRIHG